MVIAYCLLVLWALSITVWIYQAIILPSIRQRVRFELFNLRDETRQLVIDGKLKERHAAFRNLHSSLNTLIKAVPVFDYAFVKSIETSSPEALKKRQQFLKVINESIPEVAEIYQRALTAMTLMLVFNSLFWFNWKIVTAIPSAVPQGAWKLCTVTFNGIKSRVVPAFEIREEDLDLVVISGYRRRSLTAQM